MYFPDVCSACSLIVLTSIQIPDASWELLLIASKMGRWSTSLYLSYELLQCDKALNDHIAIPFSFRFLL